MTMYEYAGQVCSSEHEPTTSAQLRRDAKRRRKAARHAAHITPIAEAEAIIEDRDAERCRNFLATVRAQRQYTTVLQRLVRFHHITKRQFDTGSDIARLWGASGLEGRSIGAYHHAISSRTGHGLEGLALAQMEALGHLQSTLRRVGQLYAAELVRVCGCDEWPRVLNDLRTALELAG